MQLGCPVRTGLPCIRRSARVGGGHEECVCVCKNTLTASYPPGPQGSNARVPSTKSIISWDLSSLFALA